HNADFRARFRREVTAMTRVSGVCTARILAADPDAARPYLITEYIKGPTLGLAISKRGPMDLLRLRALAVGLAEALVSIHDAGISHRDFTPNNIILSPDGPKVIDFGIARVADSTSVTAAGSVMGTPAWMAPEQARGVQSEQP